MDNGFIRNPFSFCLFCFGVIMVLSLSGSHNVMLIAFHAYCYSLLWMIAKALHSWLNRAQQLFSKLSGNQLHSDCCYLQSQGKSALHSGTRVHFLKITDFSGKKTCFVHFHWCIYKSKKKMGITFFVGDDETSIELIDKLIQALTREENSPLIKV